ASPSRRPHVSHRLWACFEGIASAMVRDLPERRLRESERLFLPAGMTAPGMTTQARQRGSMGGTVDGGWLPPLASDPTAALRRLLRPRARGPMCRELHERFMPERVRSRNRKNRPSNIFLSTRLSTTLSPLAAATATKRHKMLQIR